MKVQMIDNNALVCPSCGNHNLHQRCASVFFRHIEDGFEGKFVKCSKDSVDEISGTNNPSIRRDGLLIKFECEFCAADPELAVFQHKGITYVEWHSMRSLVKKDL